MTALSSTWWFGIQKIGVKCLSVVGEAQTPDGIKMMKQVFITDLHYKLLMIDDNGFVGNEEAGLVFPNKLRTGGHIVFLFTSRRAERKHISPPSVYVPPVRRITLMARLGYMFS